MNRGQHRRVFPAFKRKHFGVFWKLEHRDLERGSPKL